MLLSSRNFRRGPGFPIETQSPFKLGTTHLWLCLNSEGILSVKRCWMWPHQLWCHLYLIYSERLQTRRMDCYSLLSFHLTPISTLRWWRNRWQLRAYCSLQFFMFGSNLLQVPETNGWCSSSSFLSPHASISERSGSLLNTASTLSQLGQILQEDTHQRIYLQG